MSWDPEHVGGVPAAVIGTGFAIAGAFLLGSGHAVQGAYLFTIAALAWVLAYLMLEKGDEQ